MIQLQLLNKLLDTRDVSIITDNNLSIDYFSEYPKEFKYIQTHIHDYNKIPDKESFIAEFPDFDIINVTESNDYLVKKLYEDFNIRKIAEKFNKIKDLIQSNNIEEAIQVYKEGYNSLQNNIATKAVDIINDKSRFDAYVERCNDFSKYYVKTGFEELDKAIGGWDKEEELATIVARPSVGKTWILLKCATAAAMQGLNVGIYSGEMSERKVGYRLDTLIGHVSNKKLSHGDVAIQNDYKQYIDNLPTLVKGSIKVLTPAMINGPAGVNALRSFIEKENLDILFIDQHSLLEDDRKAKNPVEKAANISRDLKNLQVIKRIPIISVSQQNRTTNENGVDTSMIAQSDRIGQDSTVIIFLEKKDNILSLYIVKSRDSESGKKLQYALDLDRGIFTYIPAESDAVQGQPSDNIDSEYIDPSNNQDGVF